jgi:hypothetical protein
MGHILTKTARKFLRDVENIDEYIKKPQSRYAFYRRVSRASKNALEELDLIAKNLPPKHLHKALNLNKLKDIIKTVIDRTPQKKSEYVKNEELFKFCMDLAYDMTIKAHQLIDKKYYNLIMRGTYRRSTDRVFLDQRDRLLLTIIYNMVSCALARAKQ